MEMNIQEIERTNNIMSLKDQEKVRNKWLSERLATVLPEAMKKAQLPMWVMISKEYNEDPVIETITPTSHDTSGRLSIIVYSFDETNNKVDRYFIGGPSPDLHEYYEIVWDRSKETAWECLLRIIEEKQPEKIGINTSENLALADGLTHSLYKTLVKEIGPSWSERLVSAEHLVTYWKLKRTESEMLTYRFLADLTSNLAHTILSNEVIYPGITTTNDVVDWIRQRVLDLGIKTSFYPTIDLQRKGADVDRLSGVTIMPGDIVHLDLGLDYLGLATDTQQLAYVLKEGETEPPKGLIDAFKHAEAFQDIVMGYMKPGMIGNEIFEKSIADSKKESIQAMLYTHPVGRHCHEAGPTIGMFDKQEKIPFRGDFDVVPLSAYALEFNIKAYIPEWEQETYLFLEQPVGVYEEGARYLTPRQEEFYLIR